MNEPFFSVIVPAHNAQSFIRKCLDSIRKQTYTKYELIVVCDKCTDRTAQICREEYRAKVIETDYGLDGLARNAGIEAAAGDWILFLDHDDWWLHECVLQMLADEICRKWVDDIDVIMFNFIWKDAEKGKDGQRYSKCIQQVTNRYVAVWSKCWRRSFIGDTRFPATPYWSDVAFNKEMFDKNPIYDSFDHELYYYNFLKPGSISWMAEQGEISKYEGGM